MTWFVAAGGVERAFQLVPKLHLGTIIMAMLGLAFSRGVAGLSLGTR
jgi:hypothetical protein